MTGFLICPPTVGAEPVIFPTSVVERKYALPTLKSGPSPVCRTPPKLPTISPPN